MEVLSYDNTLLNFIKKQRPSCAAGIAMQQQEREEREENTGGERREGEGKGKERAQPNQATQ